MRHDAWRLDAATYPLRGEMLPRYSEVDVWQHLNNTALISIHGDLVQHALNGVFGADAWRIREPALACSRSATDFLAEAHYPAPIAWGAKVLGVDSNGVRVATALFQEDRCVGLHEATLAHWSGGGVVALGPERLAALRDAGVPGADTLGAGDPAADPASGPTPALTPGPTTDPVADATDSESFDTFPWRATMALRYGDSDSHRFASDTWLARCAEQARVKLMDDVYGPGRPKLGGMMVAHVSLRWLQRKSPPAAQWQVGSGITHTGQRSVTMRGVMFDSGRRVAVCDSVVVVVDREKRQSAPLSDEARAMLEPYRLRASRG